MDGDLIAQVQELLGDLDGEDLVTLHGVAELVEGRITAAQFDLMLDWRAQGWEPNAPGLRCEVCGGPTWGTEDGVYELVKCVDVMCGHLRYVVVG